MFDSKVLITIISFLIFIAICVAFVFGEESPIKTIKNKPEDRFVKILDYGTNFIMYDKETKVEYYAFSGGISVLYDENGKPLLYEGE